MNLLTKESPKQRYYRKHKTEVIERTRQRRLANPEERRAWDKKHSEGDSFKSAQMKYRFGVTLEKYEAVLKAQGGVCAICAGPPSGAGERYHIDHDHATNEFRGLLCHLCNVALGMMRDRPDFLRKAAAYLEVRRGADLMPPSG